MADTFMGDLSQIRLVHILRLLVSEGKTGQLMLTKGNDSGEIFVENGDITHASSTLNAGEEALLTMMTWMIGKFNFTPGVLPEEKSIRSSTDKLLAEGSKRIEEWEHLREIIPSTDVVFRLAGHKRSDDINLKSTEWNMLTQVDGARSVGEISKALNVDEIGVAKILYNLYSAGLLEVVEKPKPLPEKMVGMEFFKRIDEELAKALGPIASVIVDDQIAEMGEQRDAFPRDKAAELVEVVSSEIADGGKRIWFQRSMLEILRNI
ncbi:MAG: DUF4388 domain-containing protein [Syntrophobacterales bacterium]|nr:MAG: DUF4388 domain-containing protein [Syntrophobacterales bacterium]